MVYEPRKVSITYKYLQELVTGLVNYNLRSYQTTKNVSLLKGVHFVKIIKKCRKFFVMFLLSIHLLKITQVNIAIFFVSEKYVILVIFTVMFCFY